MARTEGAGPATEGGESVEQRFVDEVRDAISLRTALLVFGVLVLQLAFIWSYVGAFHHPTPHEVPLAVVAPAAVSGKVVHGLNSIESAPLRATAVATAAEARRQVRAGTVSGALLIDPTSTTDTLLVASGGGASTAAALEIVLARAEAAQHRTIRVVDVVPLQPGDARGLTGFYLVIGWIVGGYLVAALLGVARGARPATLRRAVIRLGSVVPYALVSGLAGAVMVGPVLGALRGHLVALSLIGALLVFSAATVTMALQVVFGTFGIGLTVLLFVVLGNPSAGGAYSPALLPPLWRDLGGALPNGAGTAAVRGVVVFRGVGAGQPARDHRRVRALRHGRRPGGVVLPRAPDHARGRRGTRRGGRRDGRRAGPRRARGARGRRRAATAD